MQIVSINSKITPCLVDMSYKNGLGRRGLTFLLSCNKRVLQQLILKIV